MTICYVNSLHLMEEIMKFGISELFSWTLISLCECTMKDVELIENLFVDLN